MRRIIATSLLIVAAGCVHQPQGKFHRVSDGKAVDADQTLYNTFLQDKVICDGEAAQAALTSTEKSRYAHSLNVNLVYDACLAKRGYVRK
jgi:hypothetical protein